MYYFLADVFENFTKMCLKIYDLDHAKFISKKWANIKNITNI